MEWCCGCSVRTSAASAPPHPICVERTWRSKTAPYRDGTWWECSVRSRNRCFATPSGVDGQSIRKRCLLHLRISFHMHGCALVYALSTGRASIEDANLMEYEQLAVLFVAVFTLRIPPQPRHGCTSSPAALHTEQCIPEQVHGHVAFVFGCFHRGYSLAGMYRVDWRKLAENIYAVGGSLRKRNFIVQVSHFTDGRWMNRLSRSPYLERHANNIVLSKLCINHCLIVNSLHLIPAQRNSTEEATGHEVSVP